MNILADCDSAKVEYRAALAAFEATPKPATIAELRTDEVFRAVQTRIVKATNELRRLGIR